MKTLRILQCNTDNLRHGWDYLDKLLNTSDIALLQRFPRDMNPKLCDSMTGGRTILISSLPPSGNLCIAIARRRSSSSFTGTEEISLPSKQHVIAEGDEWQGCMALRATISNIDYISFLPCYPTVGEFPITDDVRLKDIEFILEKSKNTPTIIAGDFHVDEKCEKTNALIKKYGFKSYLDNHATFTQGDRDFNLDKLISNVDISIENVIVYKEDVERGHHAIMYDLNIKDK